MESEIISYDPYIEAQRRDIIELAKNRHISEEEAALIFDGKRFHDYWVETHKQDIGEEDGR
tara:strand:- start:239 stop:421 length:183 start_codon:yes stop_codon:yes gene_type:complete